MMNDSFMDDDAFVSIHDTEMGAIRGMLRVAAEHGLEREVVREAILQFNPEAGVDIVQACVNALVEWDL